MFIADSYDKAELQRMKSVTLITPVSELQILISGNSSANFAWLPPARKSRRIARY